MNRLGQFLVRHSKSALFGFIALVAISGIWGFQAFGLLKGGGYDDPGSDSARVVQILTDEFDQSTAEVVLIADFGSAAADPASIAIGERLTQDLEAIAGVDSVSSFFSMGLTPTLASDDGTAVYFFVDVSEDVTQSAVANNIANRFTGNYQGADIYVAGFAAVTSSINHAIESDLKTAELVAVPLVLLLLVFVFGSLVAAGLPMLIAGLSIVGTFFFIWLSAQFTDTSIFSVNLVSGLGLGLGIDYALLMVNRFREERAAGKSVPDSTIRTLETAGRTVLFSGLTVAIVLGALGFFPQYFLQSFALGGVVVVAIAVAGALIALPALLNLIGDKVNSVKIRRNLTPKDSKGWGSVARFVMKRPVSVLLVTLVGLGSLTSLAVGVEFGQVDDRVLKQDDRVVVASNFIRDNFTARESSPVEILVKGADDQQIFDYASSIQVLDHITRVQVMPTEANGWTQIVAIHEIESRSPAGITLTDAIRTVQIEGAEVLVGGSAAIYTDSQQGIERQLALAAGWIVIWTLVLLFFFTGSILLPIKAVLLNVLSLGATFGFVAWVFAEGNLKWLIGDFFVTGTIDTSSSVMIVVVAFGLSMDYELFLLSRIKEQHDAGLGTNESVAVGLQRSGRIITAAALVLAFSFIAFVTSGVTIMKMLGLGIAFAILLDATVVRALLVPALMRLFGDANWWAPKWMKRLYKRVGLDH